MKVVSISGGRSSAMMLKLMQDNQMLDDAVVCFANTGKESPETLDFIQECATRWGIDVVWLEYCTEIPKFKIVDYETAARKGEPFEALIGGRKGYLPNPTQRFCTGDMKVKTIKRFVRSLGYKGNFDTYIGLRYDEPSRAARKKAQNAAGKESEIYFMPLYDLRITVAERDLFWRNQPFDLKIHSAVDNCDLCFMKSKWDLIWTIREKPELADWWIKQEESACASPKRKRNGQFRKEYSYVELKHIALSQTFLDIPRPRGVSLTCSCHD